MELAILVTATSKSPISVFNIYSPTNPTAILDTHDASIIALKIHYPINYLYSLSINVRFIILIAGYWLHIDILIKTVFSL